MFVFNECLTRCNYPSENSIFSLNNSTSYGGFYKSKQLIEECNYKTLDEIDDDLQKKLYPLNYKKINIAILTYKLRLVKELIISRSI